MSDNATIEETQTGEETQLELLPAPVPPPDVPEGNGDAGEKSDTDTKSLHLDENGSSHTVFTNATSFEELESEQEAKDQARQVRNDAALVPQMVNNIMFSVEEGERETRLSDLGKSFMSRITDIFTKTKQTTPMKTEGGVKYPKSDFAFTPSDKPSTWKLRLSQSRPGNITISQLGRAAAAFSAGGFRGNKVQIPSASIAKVKSRIRSAYRKLGVKPADIPKSVKEQSLMFWKEGNRTRFFAIYSNNYRDQDNPPEIISSASHERFVKMVDAGEYPMPVLQHYHIPGTEWGQADWVSYDKDTGFMMASGYILPDHEKEVEAISNMDNIALSHGMPHSSIKRSTDDSTIIIEHQTEEISDLPLLAAANKLTSFEILTNEQKETTMPIPDEKKAYLEEVGLTTDKITSIDQSLDAKKESAMTQELESKEETQEEAPETLPEATPEPVTETKETLTAAFNEAQTKEFAEFATTFRTTLLKEVSELLKETLAPLTDAVSKQALANEELVAQTPPMSVSDAIFGGAILKGFSALEAEETLIDKRTKEAKEDGPLQASSNIKQVISTGNPLIDGIVPDIVANTPLEEIKV